MSIELPSPGAPVPVQLLREEAQVQGAVGEPRADAHRGAALQVPDLWQRVHGAESAVSAHTRSAQDCWAKCHTVREGEEDRSAIDNSAIQEEWDNFGLGWPAGPGNKVCKAQLRRTQAGSS